MRSDPQGEHQVMKAEVEVTQLQSQGTSEVSGKPLEARKRQGRAPLRVSEGAWPCQHPDFRHLAFIAVHSVGLSYPVCGTLLW